MIGHILKRCAAEFILVVVGLCLVIGGYIHASWALAALGVWLWLSLIIITLVVGAKR